MNVCTYSGVLRWRADYLRFGSCMSSHKHERNVCMNWSILKMPYSVKHSVARDLVIIHEHISFM